MYRSSRQSATLNWLNGVKRGQFRLHPKGGRGLSIGCITVENYAEFSTIRRSLLHTGTVQVGSTGLLAYGTIEVMAHGDTCP
ncbi:tlde1 domain-containing protein [Paraburkholderia sejongensis]|uniref:tlde1 domain-containing protein n=1 Tax=Paraburkholderia sejongensis TaxID=2886946 RepID=UPI002E76EB1F|nr:tlde1 domain-containing protein [Paraburkholderia sp. MMS20-SJTR3]